MATTILPPAAAASSADPTPSTTGKAPRVGALPASMAAVSRRGILGAIVAAPAIVAASASASAAILPAAANTTSPEMAALIADAIAAETACEAHHENVYMPAYDRMNAAVEAVPHVTMDGGPNASGGAITWSSARAGSIASALAVVKLAREGRGYDPKIVAQARRFMAAHIRRQRAIAAIKCKAGLKRLADDSNALGSEVGEAQHAVATYPVTTAADLCAKLAFMDDREMGDGPDWLSELLADARAIAGQEG